MRFAALLFALPLVVGACGAAHDESAQSVPTPGIVKVSKYAVACRGFEDPAKIGPPIYAVSDMGKPGVPKLTTDQLALIKRIQRYVHSSTLSFAFVPTRPQWLGGPFIVFDATQGPCIDVAGAYPVLNGVHEFYEDGDNPFVTKTGPPEVEGTRAPWMTPSPRPSRKPALH